MSDILDRLQKDVTGMSRTELLDLLTDIRTARRVTKKPSKAKGAASKRPKVETLKDLMGKLNPAEQAALVKSLTGGKSE